MMPTNSCRVTVALPLALPTATHHSKAELACTTVLIATVLTATVMLGHCVFCLAQHM